MEFKLVTPPQVEGLPQRPSYLQCGNSIGNMSNIRITHDGKQFRVMKCTGVCLQEEIATPDFQAALYHAHRMWNIGKW